jgi:ribonuclease E
MASPDESRVDEARDQSGAPTSPDPMIPDPADPADPAASTPRLNGDSSADEPSEAVSPGRPRGAASFPGGAPPATTAPAEVAIPSAPPPPTAPPSFRVTTVEPTAASFPGGPPPERAAEPRPETPSPDGAAPPAAATSTASPAAPADAPSASSASSPTAPPTDAAAPPAQSPSAPATDAAAPPTLSPSAPATDATTTPPASPSAPTTDVDATPAQSPGAPATDALDVDSGGPGTRTPDVDAAGRLGTPAADVEQVGESSPAAPAGVEAEVTEVAGGRTGGRRRRRGRGGRTAAVADTAGELAEAETAAPTAPGAARPAPAAASVEAPQEAAEAGAGPAGSGAGQAAGREQGDGEATGGDSAEGRDAAEGRVAVAMVPSGSARTRARRRRRAAAKTRTRTADVAPAPEPLATPAPEPAAPAPRAGETATHADDQPTGRRGRRAAPAAEATAEPTQTPDEAAPTARSSSRTSRRGARATAPDPRANGEAAAEPRAARPAEPQPGREPAGNGGERGSGRTRRRGRGRLAAAKDDTAAATATAAPEAPPARPAAERSTRLETRGRSGRHADRSRRHPSGLTEEQKRVLREEGPAKRMLVTEGAERTQIGVLEGPTLVELYVTRKAGRSMVGNIYLGRVQNVLPGMEAAFIDIGRGRNAVLYAGEVNYNEEDLDGEAPRIEKVLKPGQPVLVQVTKDPIGAKGARLTAQVSLAGRYLVLQPEDNTFGISRRLPEEERSRLRDILREVRPKGLGLIVRTAAEGASADDLRADLARLQARWETIERKAKKVSAPAVIYSEPELVVRVIRDIFSPDFAELVVDDDELYQRVHEYLQEVAPDLLPKLRRHDGALPLFEDYRVVEQLHKALERKVWLPSGGSIVIDRTEAMTVVDVNTGKFVGRANLEETVVANNLEAADEIVRQLRLRDIGGIIIIDFIDMLFERNQQAVVDRLRDALTRDKTKSQVMEVSSLGLVQMTRKRVSGGLLETFSETCPTCDGRGVVITHNI